MAKIFAELFPASMAHRLIALSALKDVHGA
jgi:hypothetical protein